MTDAKEMARLTRDYFWKENDTTTEFLKRILEAKHAKVEFADFGKEMYKRDGYYIITLPRYTGIYHDNYTIAVDIARIILGENESLNTYNRFASELVMPERLFRDKVMDFKGDVIALSHFFNINELNIRGKKYILGLEHIK